MTKKYDLPSGWKLKPFAECIEKSPSSNKLKIPQKDFERSGLYPIIDQGADFIAGYTNDSSKICKDNLPVIIFGDHTRIFKFVDFPFALGADGTKILIPKKEIFDPKYFYFFLKGLTIENQGYSRHYKILKEKQIVIPPLPTQKKIVSILEKAEKLKEWRKEADELDDKFLRNIFLDMFGDPVKNPNGFDIVKLGDFGEISSGLTLNSQRRNEKENLFPYLRVANVFRNRLDLSEIKYIHISDAEIGRFMLKENDVLVVEGHGNIEEIGRAAVWKGEISNCAHQNHIIKVRLNQECIQPFFLSYFLNMYGSNGYFSSESRTTSGLNTISTNKVRNAEIFLPPIDLQRKFERIITSMDKIKEYSQNSAIQINDLFGVLMQKSFKGALIN